MRTQEQEQERWQREKVEWARGDKAQRRRIQKRQWARRQRASLKGHQALMMYFPSGLLEEVEEFRPKGMGRSAALVLLIKAGLEVCRAEVAKQRSQQAVH